MSGCRLKEVTLYFLPVRMRVPLKFGAQLVTEATCARVRVRIEDAAGRRADGWGETPLSVAWVWPAATPDWTARESRLRQLCAGIARALPSVDPWEHPIDLCSALLPLARGLAADVPLLATLCCLSPFDLAVFDAFGNLHGKPVFDLLDVPVPEALGPELRGLSISRFIEPRRDRLPVWHLVGGVDPLEPVDLTGDEPDDGYPVLLRDWIRRDGLRCLKVKLRGTDPDWDINRLRRVGRIALEEGCTALSADFNCTVTDPAYVCESLDLLERDAPEIHRRLLYIEQPFPYDLDAHRIDVRAVSARKPLFLDESAHDWEHVRLGRDLGWTGVALKTCKTLSGALLSLCWARAHGLSLMVQDLTNPMLAQIPHVSLAAHAGTLMGVESNAMQFYPDASLPEESVHPGLFRRRGGELDLSTLGPTGFGLRVAEIKRTLPAPAVAS